VDATERRSEPAVRVSTLELFFDLVFVFTITQFTAVLASRFTVVSVLRVMLMLAIVAWMYGGYAWLTNAVAPTSRVRRTLILVGMAGFLGIALAIPDAFGAAGWVFGLGYFVVNAVHTGLFVYAGGGDVMRAMKGLGPLNLITATLVLAGGIATGWWRLALWIAAVGMMLASPYLHDIGGFTISPSHFVERHGLLFIIAIGESVVAIGAGAAGLPVDVRLLTVAVLGMTLSYLMWWVYFGGDDGGAEEALAAIDPSRRARAALSAYGWAHYFILLGIVILAAGVKKAIGHATDHLALGQAIAIGAGLAVFLAGDVAFRRVLRIGQMRYRAVAAAACLVTVPIGLILAGAQLAALIALLLAMLVIEARAARR
jgi:low temperature requirement protein LtrA